MSNKKKKIEIQREGNETIKIILSQPPDIATDLGRLGQTQPPPLLLTRSLQREADDNVTFMKCCFFITHIPSIEIYD